MTVKSRAFAGKSSRQAASGAVPKNSSGGENAAVLAPPSYGIEFIDGAMSANAAPLQRRPEEDEEESVLQGKVGAGAVAQAQADSSANRTGMPDGLKAGIESLSGMDMSDVRVNFNSARPARIAALAYAQGNDIH